MILVFLDSWKLPEGFKGRGAKKSEQIFPVDNRGKQKYFCAVETSQESRAGQQWPHLRKGNFHIWRNMVIINDLGKPRKWTMLEKYAVQGPSHCQLNGPENWIVLERGFYLRTFAYRCFLLGILEAPHPCLESQPPMVRATLLPLPPPGSVCLGDWPGRWPQVFCFEHDVSI